MRESVGAGEKHLPFTSDDERTRVGRDADWCIQQDETRGGKEEGEEEKEKKNSLFLSLSLSMTTC